jgi:hypothetical protein
MNSGTPEVPEIFNSPEDPFPHLRFRDILVAVGSVVDQENEGYQRTESEDPSFTQLEDVDRELTSEFSAIVREKYRRLLTADAQIGYIQYWQQVHKLTEYHQVASKYGMGAEQPDPGSSDKIMLDHRLGLDGKVRGEYIQHCLDLIDEARFPEFLDLVFDTEIGRKDVIVEHLGISDEERTTGLLVAYSDARLLLLEARFQIPYSERL